GLLEPLLDLAGLDRSMGALKHFQHAGLGRINQERLLGLLDRLLVRSRAQVPGRLTEQHVDLRGAPPRDFLRVKGALERRCRGAWRVDGTRADRFTRQPNGVAGLVM